jgi:2-polyprenyl-3-methyl-5-hydroxy-6-metoxy-1,4-benzoquinol methylase
MDEHTRKKLGVEENKPNDWFESLYSESNEAGNGIPWANMTPHPLFKSWMKKNPNIGKGKTALVIGCGMGDDAVELESNGFKVTAFDVSHSAIELCKKRFPNSKVEFVQADLIEGVSKWQRKFDFVLEIFTIQALPPKYENLLINNISEFVSNNGRLIVITEVQIRSRSYENGPPWLLNDDYTKSFKKCGLTQIFHFNSPETEMGDEIHLTIFQRLS